MIGLCPWIYLYLESDMGIYNTIEHALGTSSEDDIILTFGVPIFHFGSFWCNFFKSAQCTSESAYQSARYV